MPKSLCFSPSLATLPHRSGVALSKRTPACVLDSAAPSKANKKTYLPKQKDTSPNPWYHVLPENVNSEDLPPPPPVHRSMPFVGYFLENFFKLSTPTSRAKRYGGVYTSNFFMDDSHFVTHPEAIVDMIKNTDVFKNAGSSSILESVFGKKSMILIDAPDHTIARGVLAPAFSPNLFPFYLDIILSQVEKTYANVEKSVAANGAALLEPSFRELYLSIIVRLTTGMDIDSDRASFLREKFVQVQKGFASPRVGPIWKEAMKAKQDLLDIVRTEIDKCLVVKADVIDKLREYGEKLSYMGSKDIMKGQVTIIMIAMAFSDLKTGKGQENNPATLKRMSELLFGLWFAGYATSAATTSCAAFEMGLNPSIWDQLSAEQDKIMSSAGSKTVTYEQIQSKMPLLESYITEILRLYPAAKGVHRKVNRDLEVLGRHIKAGSRVFFDFASAMRDEQMYEDADTLKVDRFVKQRGKATVPRVLTFGGPGSVHFCLGAALAMVMMKSSLSVLLRKYRMELDSNQSREYTWIPGIVPKSKIVVRRFLKRSDE